MLKMGWALRTNLLFSASLYFIAKFEWTTSNGVTAALSLPSKRSRTEERGPSQPTIMDPETLSPSLKVAVTPAPSGL